MGQPGALSCGGPFNCSLLVLESAWASPRILERAGRPVGHAYAFLVVIISWILFRTESASAALSYAGSMLGLGQAEGANGVTRFLNAEVFTILCIALIGMTSIPARQGKLLLAAISDAGNRIRAWAASGITIATLLCTAFLVAMALAGRSHNPFIYFRF